MINPARAGDIASLAALTSQCRASDPRDRIFAIAQLLSNAKLRVSLVADYTLSFRHLAIGFFAHTFLVAQKSFFFDHAGLLYSTQSPSWVPVCRSDREWERALVGAIPRNIDITPFDAIATVDCMVYLDERSMVTLKEMVVAYDYQPAYSSPFVVDSATGALLMNLTHLFMFEHEPKVLPTQGSLHFYEVVTTATLEPIPRLCLFASTQLQIEVGDHVFTFPMKEQIEDYVKWEDNSYVAMPPDYHDDRFGPRGLMLTGIQISHKSNRPLRNLSKHDPRTSFIRRLQPKRLAHTPQPVYPKTLRSPNQRSIYHQQYPETPRRLIYQSTSMGSRWMGKL
ncbi:hypothetical protein HBH56_015620 [Parastagonospora nodorum]|nr:hypothetical protein HBH56_015620 [Parastagonospora nodorum]KAH3936894.1 hypothetical protein HBH54_018820 [Parastagonospora nodorum]KAH3969490.1 hypothetical protein HBH51_123390 [Parastagonospora nodorum]KAH4007015.1 hypothetical protein HBI10_018660 [Parastagonospora nodorum]KAH4015367.1 hypothetical protein HBI13_161970 [Parastagonospora nodorum]